MIKYREFLCGKRMKVRFFGSSNCRDCLEVFVILSKFSIDFEYIDAFDDDTQDLVIEWMTKFERVAHMPSICILFIH